jgi:protease stability complex PrcB-like protein
VTNIRGLNRIGTAVLLFISAGCQQTPVNVTEIINYSQCKTLRTGMTRVEFDDLPAIRGVKLLSQPQTANAQQSESTNLNNTSARQDRLLVAVSNGSQATPGYKFELLNARAEGNVVYLDYRWLTPAADSVQAQVITSPCSVVQIETQAQLSAVYATLDGKTLGSLTLD